MVGLAVRLTVGSKRKCELTSSIVPRWTSFHHTVELEHPPIAFDPEGPSCRGMSEEINQAQESQKWQSNRRFGGPRCRQQQ
jgi:hypothetical protein